MEHHTDLTAERRPVACDIVQSHIKLRIEAGRVLLVNEKLPRNFRWELSAAAETHSKKKVGKGENGESDQSHEVLSTDTSIAVRDYSVCRVIL